MNLVSQVLRFFIVNGYSKFMLTASSHSFNYLIAPLLIRSAMNLVFLTLYFLSVSNHLLQILIKVGSRQTSSVISN
jgi:hypothetical protein